MNYQDFQILVDKNNNIRASSEQGDESGELQLNERIIKPILNLIELRQANKDLQKDLGNELYQALFPNQINALFHATMASTQAKGDRVRLRLIFESPQLAALPWEFLYDERTNTFLGNNTDTVLSRYIDVPLQKRDIKAASLPLKVLLVISSPSDLAYLDANGEEQFIREALGKHIEAGQIELDVLKEATTRNIRQKLREKPYNVFHFIGHGEFKSDKGYICLVDEYNKAQLLDDENFANFFLGDRSLGLVILNCCRGAMVSPNQAFAGTVSNLVRRGIPAVVAMQYNISDSTAKLFADEFYRTLALGYPVDTTIQTTRNAISIDVGLDRRDFGTPVLYMRAKDGIILSGLGNGSKPITTPGTFVEIQLKSLNKELEKLKKDYEAVADKKIRESNPVEERNLELQLDDIAKKINNIELKVKDLQGQAGVSKIKELQKILSQLTTKEEITTIKKAYLACSPKGWEHLPTDKPEEILVDVTKMRQGDSKYTRVEHFVACLIALIENNPSLIFRLNQWAKDINKFDDLLRQEQQNIAGNCQKINPYLLILVEKSNQDSASNNSDFYRIQASYIPNIERYKYNHENKTCDGCEQLNLNEYENKTFTIDQIKDVLNNILNKKIEYNHDSYRNLTIEIFLPLNLLNHPVDCWEFQDGTEMEDLDLGFTETQGIGQEYKVVVRSYERWSKLYEKKQYRYSWEEKWDKLKESPCMGSALSLGSEDAVNDLINRRREIIGLKVVEAPKKIGKGSIFAAIIKTAIPVALWLRQNPPNLDCQSQIEQILSSCRCIHDLPNTLKNERSSAKQNVETDIGNHLSLLLEDPYRLPPSINYSM